MSGTRWPRYCAGRSAAAAASQTTDEPMASSASHVRRALGAVSFLGVAIGVSAALSPPEQPLDIGERELHVGGAAVIALAGIGRRLHFPLMTQAHIDYMLSKIPLGRLGEAQGNAAPVRWAGCG